MTILKRLSLLVLVTVVLVAIGWLAFGELHKMRILDAVEDGQVSIDQESHQWRPFASLDEEAEVLTLDLYVRNKSNYLIDGTLVFSVRMSHKGLEESYLDKFFKETKERFRDWDQTKQELITYFNNAVDKKAKAMSSYLERGEQLPEGMDYEPIVGEEKEDYIFKFRKAVFLSAGELIRIEQEQVLPSSIAGYLLTVEIETIEF